MRAGTSCSPPMFLHTRRTRGAVGGEADRVPVLRALAGDPGLAGAHGAGRARAERRARGGRRGARPRRRLRAGASLRPPARVPVPVAREEAAATELLSDGRLQLGISRGSPETALLGSQSFGYVPAEGSSDAELARQKTALFLAAIAGQPMVDADPRMTGGMAGKLAIQPQSPGLADRIWWGSGTRATAEWTARQGLNLMSSTLLSEDTGVPFDQLQAEQIARFRAVWAEAGWPRDPRVSVSRSVIPIVSDRDREYFGDERSSQDQVGLLDGVRARFGKSYAGEPDELAEELAQDAAVQAADTLLLTVPNMLGVEYNARLLETIVQHVAPAIGWVPPERRDH